MEFTFKDPMDTSCHAGLTVTIYVAFPSIFEEEVGSERIRVFSKLSKHDRFLSYWNQAWISWRVRAGSMAPLMFEM